MNKQSNLFGLSGVIDFWQEGKTSKRYFFVEIKALISELPYGLKLEVQISKSLV